MAPVTPGIHHVTAIVGDPQRNADFYVGVLGLRFVKKTVNHDDTGTYHFYFGDGEGTPGTNITFFAWGEQGQRGTFGAGQTQTTAYLVDEDSLDYWADRLAAHDVEVTREERFDETVLGFEDPDGIGLELVAADAPSDATPWADSPVPEAHQLKGFYSVRLAVSEFGPTEEILTDVLGFEHEATDGGRRRYRSATGGPGSVVDLVETDQPRGRMGAGTVHHVAFEAADEATMREFREAYKQQEMKPSEVIDRKYFRALYAREPGGVLFELSTPGPGFAVDEDLDSLGTSLTLPEWLESDRDVIERQLLPFDGPSIPAEK
ncbi:ring-cleaving dioxygenase [Halomicroarcula sp. GCM10025324]|uniref:ring-cleaving dioxygenase n=1 Tax=Haloarcula TaxID=2237 RepID=UPI0023E8A676|nr:ring-cleaving dioxygenase [Halomicroarcula sp. ZS-22-S1]